jgi:hypothetical protein
MMLIVIALQLVDVVYTCHMYRKSKNFSLIAIQETGVVNVHVDLALYEYRSGAK